MMIFFLIIRVAAAATCLITTTLPATTHVSFTDRDMKACIYPSIVVTPPNIDADNACLSSLDKPNSCVAMYPLFNVTSYTGCDPVRSCRTKRLITPSFRYTTLLHSLYDTDVLTSPYWTYMNQHGDALNCGVGTLVPRSSLMLRRSYSSHVIYESDIDIV
jgi:hypothetical protein